MAQRKRVRQRPRLSGDRLAELLDVAAEVFTADGFQGASTNVIAQRAGASKASLYSRFPTKEDLFLAVLEHRMNIIFRDTAGSISRDAPLRDTLFNFGTRLLRSGLSDAQIALLRVVSMETARFPELGRRFFELGPERGLKALSAYLRGHIQRRTLSGPDPRIMAQQFIGMVAGPALLFRLLGIKSHLKTAKQRSEHVESAIDSFLLAHRTKR